jgi:ATP-binding cassette subfamily B protein
LISRLYDVTDGKITIDDQEISSLNLYDLRNSIGIVPQDAFLFSDSIETLNLVKDATDEEVESAAKSAVVHDNIIGFKKQYETVLGERLHFPEDKTKSVYRQSDN